MSHKNRSDQITSNSSNPIGGVFNVQLEGLSIYLLEGELNGRGFPTHIIRK